MGAASGLGPKRKPRGRRAPAAPARAAIVPAGGGAAADALWRDLTERGNAAFAEGRMDEAARFYADAIAEAEILFELVARLALAPPAPAPVLINVAHHNAAEAEMRRGRPDEAERLCLRAFERLAGAAEAPATPVRLRRDCAANLKQALIALGSHLVGQGAPPERIEPHIERARRIASGGTCPAEEAPKPQRPEPGA